MFEVYRMIKEEFPSILTIEEEVQLCIEKDQGSEEAFDMMVRRNVGLVMTIAQKDFKNKGVGIEDLIQEGCIGLIRAVEKYDYEQGKFSTYASWWIKQKMRAAIFSQSTTKTVKETRCMLVKKNKIKAIEKKLKKAKRPHDHIAIAKKLEMKPSIVLEALNHSIINLSLDYKIPNAAPDNNTCMKFYSSNEKTPYVNLESKEWIDNIDNYLSRLDERERLIIELRFGLNGYTYTLEEVAAVIERTGERVRQLEARALKKLKGYLEEKLPQVTMEYLSKEDVREIRKLSKEGLRYKEIANRFNLNANHVSEIINRKVWKGVK